LAGINRTLDLIAQGGPFPFPEDGGVYRNRDNVLPPGREDYYREYTVTTPGARGRGRRRIVTGSEGETYYSDDHYRSFVRIDQAVYP